MRLIWPFLSFEKAEMIIPMHVLEKLKPPFNFFGPGERWPVTWAEQIQNSQVLLDQD